ncbi:MAG: hypothetical protein B7Y45_10270 [Sphingomonas sp. 28-66-16]|nr:MAG: hypothetical protein B7Y45_10270 [Sphingomonas sp. 28-66-16]
MAAGRKSGGHVTAADAVRSPTDGTIVCRTTLAGLDPGCVPINLFGNGSPSQAAINYVTGGSGGGSYSNLTTKEDVLSATVRGTPFALPAGDINFAAGIEHRRESGRSMVDSITSTPPDGTGLRNLPGIFLTGIAGGRYQNNPQPINGKYTVDEVFGEIEIPLLKDSSFAHLLSINGAIRYIDYSTVGGVTTWKLGVSYEPFAGVRVRGTRSRDIRAANISELYQGATQATGSVIYQGQTRTVVGLRSGNLNLAPEKADTTTVGLVFRPEFAPGFGASIDLYQIKINGAITQLTNQQTADLCAAGASTACAQITTNTIGALTFLTPFLNIASSTARGIDFEVDYSSDLGSGRVTARALASYLDELSTTLPGSPSVDRAGDLGLSGTPKWSGTASLNYDVGPLGLFVQERLIGGGKVDTTFNDSILGEANDIGPILYTDLTIKFRVEGKRKLEFFATASNLLNQEPKVVPANPLLFYRSTNPALYDVVGRYVTVGARVAF